MDRTWITAKEYDLDKLNKLVQFLFDRGEYYSGRIEGLNSQISSLEDEITDLKFRVKCLEDGVVYRQDD